MADYGETGYDMGGVEPELPEAAVDTYVPRPRSRYRRPDYAQYKIATTNMWTGLSVFAMLGLGVLAFAYFTILQQNQSLLWVGVIVICLVVLYAGWGVVSSDDGGSQFIGRAWGR